MAFPNHRLPDQISKHKGLSSVSLGAWSALLVTLTRLPWLTISRGSSGWRYECCQNMAEEHGRETSTPSVSSGISHRSPSGSSRSCSPELMPQGTPPSYLLSRDPVLFFSSSAAHDLCLWCKRISHQPQLLVGSHLHTSPTPMRRTVSLQTTLAFPGSWWHCQGPL